MLQLGGQLSPAEHTMNRIVREVLDQLRFSPVTAADIRRTSDFLAKIIDLIRGTGFGIALFSDRTPARTLANIFFEIGAAAVLGKPVQLIWTGRYPRSNAAPTDFIRTEWIRYVVDEEERLRQEVNNAISEIEGAATTFYRQMGDVALEALEPDLELAFDFDFRRSRCATAYPIRSRAPGRSCSRSPCRSRG
jgi:hypothetical protein